MLASLIIGLLSIVLPGFFIAFGLLYRTKLHPFEIAVIGFTFGMVFPPVTIWLEAYLIPYMHFFSYSESLYNINVIVLTLFGAILCYQQGVFDAFLKRSNGAAEVREADAKGRIRELRRRLREAELGLEVIKKHESEEEMLASKNESEISLIADKMQRERISALHAQEEVKLLDSHELEERLLFDSAKPGAQTSLLDSIFSMKNAVWFILLALMIITFATRIVNIGTAPKFFEFDPYFDMQSTEYILAHGQQLLFDHSAWPVDVNGTIHRIQPLLPYLEAYWYNIANGSTSTINLNTLSTASSMYPPIVAALLVFSVFLILYHDYGRIPALLGAALATGMPTLISSFIAGEQLLEPWGIFSMFFFYAAMLLAVKNPKEKRFAVLAGIAFAMTFLGAHYYTVTAGVFAAYILLQGLISVLRGESTKDFYTMNMVIIAVIAIFYILYAPYGATLSNRIPNMLGIPVILAFPIFALAFAALVEYMPKILQQRKLLSKVDFLTRLYALILLVGLALLLILFSPIGNPVKSYIALSIHFTTQSIPLFLTVQEYQPTGINYDFGGQGFGLIGSSIGGVSILVWSVLALFSILVILAIYNRRSKSSILYLGSILPLAVAGMIEVKYLPHFGVGYIIAIGVIIGELMIFINNDYRFKPSADISDSAAGKHRNAMLAIYAACGFLVLIGLFPSIYSVFSAAANPNCNAIANASNGLGYNLFCVVVPQYWLSATSWMRTNVGPYNPRILSWWDYGDWINWFGNSNAVLRGDNAVAQLDYDTAARFVFGPSDGFGPANLSTYMNSIQAKYVLFDNQLMQKWQALDYLACIDVNQTSIKYAYSQGSLQGGGSPYVLGTSQCEVSHDPVYALIPLSVSNLQSYCQFNSTSQPNITAIKSLFIYGQQFINATYCVPSSVFSSQAPATVYYPNGTATDAIIIPSQQFYYGQLTIQGQQFANFMVVYKPNGPNYTVVGAPTYFYNSNYYRGFMFGKIPGFTLAYPHNFTGMNYVNQTDPVMICQTNNYTGGLPYVTPKPPWIHNNYTVPG
jgi:asparagine N-glycosylation enzyme membrane subunit Stt3